MYPVKKISCLRSQNKEAPKFSHLINITGYPFNTSQHKKISRLRSNKFHNETIFLPVYYIFCFKILRNFPESPFVLFPKRSIQMARSQGHFRHVSHSRMMQPHSCRGGLIFLPRCRDCSESLPTTRSFVTTTEKLYQVAES
jgi:hypothetical protein